MRDLVIVTRLMMKEKRDILLSIFLGFIAGLATVLLFSASGYLISKAALQPPFYTLMILIASVKLLSFIRAFSRYGERFVSHRGTFTMLSNLRMTFYQKLEPLAPGIFNKYRSGDLLARIVGDVESLQNFFLRVVYPPIVLGLVFLSTIFFTCFYSIHIAIILFIGLLLTAVVIPAIFAIRQQTINSQVRDERAKLSTEVTEFLYGFRDLKIYQQMDNKRNQLLETSNTYIMEQEHEGINTLYNQSINNFVSLLVTWSVLAVGAYLIGQGQLDGVLLAMLVMLSITVFEDVSPMAVFPIHFNDSRRAANRLFSIVEKKDKKMVESSLFQQIVTAPTINMKGVSYTFLNEGRPAVHEVDLQLSAGSKTAIVGPSGSGKSTILQLLLKLVTTDTGKLSMNNTNFDQIQQESIWEAASVVLQENHFFYGTIRDNLQLANDGVTENEMHAMLKKVQLDHFDLDSHVFEKGENLSGGEKQRLAIARAMLKRGCFWLLDEPTSSLDAVTEQIVYNHLFQQAADDTVVLISHRLTDMERMDQIIVMDQGRVVEKGTFTELMDKRGYFYEMKELERNLL
ncbi:thiol reductant ABC exporter subunit CydC [Agaribacter marinus]|uniref:Thiol reductant ABC exporter subunit CydC n=1 Tax=Virgibacillus salarius TaxID=447199 RepID=A0A941E019_9BACI|nr:thiol reductant ABC exporter subunit CydC [Virgibacillus salarius]MBR7796478.1 thiol reductant ABC exporter subunit CydC [Virgibacillus salarius]NAZ09187.1 thiol reductant ABC exporter subunit CydC [Agaribacter marinus]